MLILRRFVYLVRKAVSNDFGFTIAMPAVIWQVTFLLIPAVILLLKSFFVSGQIIPTLHNYYACFNKLYLVAIGNSLILSYSTALLCLLFCLPLALIINFRINKNFQSLTLFFLLMPSWTNFIIRIYSWFFLLRNDGLLFQTMKALSFLKSNDSLLANNAAMLAVMVYCYFPYMLLPIYGSISNIDHRIIEASNDLGGSSLQTFWRVILPLSLKGIFFGCLVVILAAFGEFAIPEFIGGGKYAFWGELVKNNFLILSDYNSGSAVMTFGITLLFLSLSFVYVILRFLLLLASHFVSIPQNILLLKLRT